MSFVPTICAYRLVSLLKRAKSASGFDLRFKATPGLSQRAFTTDRDLEICFTNRIRRRNETELSRRLSETEVETGRTRTLVARVTCR